MDGHQIFLAVMGIAIILTVLLLLYNEISNATIVLLAVPIVYAVLCGFSFSEICQFIQDGVNGVSKNVILFMFSVMFFGVISDTGLFDIAVEKLVKKAGNNYTLLFCITVAVAIIGHLDGAGATTFLITIPPMLVIFKRLNVRPVILTTLVALVAGVMNVVPWGGPVGRVASILGMEPVDLYRVMMPGHFLGIAMIFGIAIYLARKEEKKNRGLIGEGQTEELTVDPSVLALRRPKLIPFNVVLIAAVIVSLFIKGMLIYLPFMVGTVIALLVNYRSSAEQSARIRAHAGDAVTMGLTVVAVGVLSGVIFYSPIGDAIIAAMAALIPASIASHIHSIWGLFAGPIHLISNGVEESSIVPMIAVAAEQYGVPRAEAAAAWLTGSMPAVFFTTATAAMWIGLGLAGVSYKEHLKSGVKWIALLSFCQVGFLLLIGAITF